MQSVSLLDFLRTGQFGKFQICSSIDSIEDTLGDLKDIEDGGNGEAICYFGCLQIQYDTKTRDIELVTISLWGDDFPNICENLYLAADKLGPSLSIEETLNLFDAQAIRYSAVECPSADGALYKVESGVHVYFEFDKDSVDSDKKLRAIFN